MTYQEMDEASRNRLSGTVAEILDLLRARTKDPGEGAIVLAIAAAMLEHDYGAKASFIPISPEQPS